MSIVKGLALAAMGCVIAASGAAAGPSLSRAGVEADDSAVVLVHRKARYHRHYNRGAVVRAPFAYVDTRYGQTWVDAPFTAVRVHPRGTWVRAPFVDIFVPR